MNHLTIGQITTACHGTFHGDKALLTEKFNDVLIDSRKVVPGSLFVAIDGAHVNSHKFIPDAVAAGALCVVAHEDPGTADYPYILVESTGQALLDIAKCYRDSFPDLTVIGITGSVGKTSTKEMLASVLSEKYQVHKTQGNFNNEWGLPLSIFQLKDGDEISILEMGVNHFGEMRRLSSVASPDICLLTNIGGAHLEFFKTKEGILHEKIQMVQDMKDDGRIVLNGDDPLLRAVHPIKGVTPQFFGTSDTDSVYASDIESMGLRGSDCVIHLPDGKSFSCHIPVPGSHMVLNALAAATVAYDLDLNVMQIRRGIEKFTTLPGRSHLIETANLVIVDDCYNANPVSMKSALNTLRLAIGRKVAILGDMGELGEDEAQLHYEVGEYAARHHANLIIAVGPLSRELAKGAESCKGAHTEVRWFMTREELIAELPELIHPGDNVLVKASHGTGLETVVEALKAL